jgi:hypothetical protein
MTLPGRTLRRAVRLMPLALLLAGCPTLLTMGPARTLPKGESDAWAAVGAYRTVLVTGNAERSAEWMPLLDTGARVGLGDSADMAFRIGLGGGSIGPRFQIVRSDGSVDVLFEPSLGVTGLVPGANGGIVSGLYLGLALPVGVHLGGGSQLVLTPRVALVRDDVLGRVAMPGGSLALVLRIAGSDARPWFLIPECGSAAVTGSGRSFDGPNVQCALGLAGPWR